MTAPAGSPLWSGRALDVLELAGGLRRREYTALELTDELLARADRWDGRLNAYQARFDETARQSARSADEDLARGIDRGPLQGIPIVVKDVLTSREGPTTAGSPAPHSFAEPVDSAAVVGLRAAGAVVLGKARTSEFAIGVPDADRGFPEPLNPWDADAWVGGSSSGTAAAVAGGLAPAGLGTDTGGSIRIPSACCGTTGLKPTYDRVPRAGCVPLGYSLDTVGPIARSAADCAVVLSALIRTAAAADPADWSRLPVDLHGLRVGYDPLEPAGPPPAEANQPALMAAALGVLESAGAAVREVRLPHYRELRAADQITLLAEGCAYHAAGFRRGWSAYGRSLRLRLAPGVSITAVEYVQAQRVRRAGQRLLAELMQDVDVVVTPTLTSAAPPVATMSSTRTGTLTGVHTQYFNSVGVPVLSLPIGFTSAGLPLAMQVAGRPFEEGTVLCVGHAYQVRTEWHRSLPDHLATGRPLASRASEPAPPPPGPPRPVSSAGAATLRRAGITGVLAEDAALLDESFAALEEAVRCVTALAERLPDEPALLWRA